MLRKLKFKSSQIFFKKKSGSNMKLKKIKKNNKKIRLRSDKSESESERILYIAKLYKYKKHSQKNQ